MVFGGASFTEINDKVAESAEQDQSPYLQTILKNILSLVIQFSIFRSI